jgi:hypothetical protein
MVQKNLKNGNVITFCSSIALCETLKHTIALCETLKDTIIAVSGTFSWEWQCQLDLPPFEMGGDVKQLIWESSAN